MESNSYAPFCAFNAIPRYGYYRIRKIFRNQLFYEGVAQSSNDYLLHYTKRLG